MKNNNCIQTSYSVTINVTKSLHEVFNHLIYDVSRFWPEEFEGSCSKLNDEFIFRTGDSHYSKHKVIELVPDKKIVWLVTGSIRRTDNYNWTGTKMIFELNAKGNHTQLKFTYDGVVPEDEYERLVQICDFVIKTNLYNLIESLTATIEVGQSSKEVFNAITNVANWWSKDFEGSSTKPGDEFIIDHPGQHYSKQKLVEVIPYKKIVWLVTESKLYWLKNNQEEWTNTKMIFEISMKGDKTILHFTHEGLVPEKECYTMCNKGWNIVIKDSLLRFITTGAADEEMAKAVEIRNHYFENENKMENKNYHTTITVNASADEAMKKIGEINSWWRKDFTGTAQKLNDAFTVPFGDPAFVNFTITELVPNKKVVWKVTDCFLPWFKDQKEWNNTEVVFELSEENGKIKIDFTHVGLVPEIECYTVCEKGWDGHIKNGLANYINDGKAI